MKVVIDIPEMAYEAYKEWHKNKVATVEQSIIANGTPYEERPHGEWIVDICTRTNHKRSSLFKSQTIKTRHIFFCNHCGADMREEGDR